MPYLVLRRVVYTLLTVPPLRFQNWIMIVLNQKRRPILVVTLKVPVMMLILLKVKLQYDLVLSKKHCLQDAMKRDMMCTLIKIM